MNLRDEDKDAQHDPVPVITIEAQNTGVRPVEIRGAGFLRADGERVYMPTYLIEPTRPPHTLTGGASMRFHYRSNRRLPPEKVIEVHRVFVDGGRSVWKGEPDEWLRPVTIEAHWPHV